LKRVYFVYECEKTDPLFQRALSEVLYLSGEIALGSEDFIPLSEEEKFEDNLRNQDEHKYCLYLLYKVHHFLELIYSVKVLKMGGDFVKDESGLIWLNNISRVQFKNLTINTKDDGRPRNLDNLIRMEDEKVSQELEKHFKDLERREAVKLINNIMQQHFENMKKNAGLDFAEAYYEDDISDEVFSKIHPDAPFKLSDLLKSKLTYSEIKEFIIKNSAQLGKHNKYFYDGKSVKLPTKEHHQGISSKVIPGASIRKSESSIIIKNSVLTSENDRQITLPNLRIPLIKIPNQTRSQSIGDIRTSRLKKHSDTGNGAVTEDLSTG
jgi:hypothetical protein